MDHSIIILLSSELNLQLIPKKLKQKKDNPIRIGMLAINCYKIGAPTSLTVAGRILS